MPPETADLAVQPSAQPAVEDRYVILYFAEPQAGVMGPIRRARFASIAEAVDKAHEMRHSPRFNPVEIRDPDDNLITCALMGWRVPSLHRASYAQSSRAIGR